MKADVQLLLAVALTLFIGLGIIGCDQFRMPTTADMEEFFSEHRSAIERKNVELLSALSQKRAIDLGPDTEVGYRWLEIYPPPPLYEDGELVIVRYYTHHRGFGTHSFGTGIAYLDPRIGGKTYPSLDAMTDDAKKVQGFIGYSRISGNWYFFKWTMG